MSKVRTDELKHGDKVLLVGRIVRTVDSIVDAGYIGMTGHPVRHVMYREGAEPGVWSAGNSAIDSTLWEVTQ